MTRTHLLATMVALFFLLLFTGCASNQAELDSLRGQVSRLEDRIQQLQSDKQAAENRVAALQAELDSIASREQLCLDKLDDYTVLRVQDHLLFRSGSARLTADGIRILDQVAGVLKRYPDFTTRVEGHTDNKQIKPEFQDRFFSNWELSTARATSVIHHLINKHGMSPSRLSAIGYGEFQPLATNDTAEGRQENRRVELYISPKHPVKPVG